MDFFGAGAFFYFITDLDFERLEALVSFGLLAGLEGLVGAANWDLAGEVFFEAVFSFTYSNSVSSFRAECLLGLKGAEASATGFFEVDFDGFLCDFLTGDADFLGGDADFGDALFWDLAGDTFLLDFCFFAVDFSGDFFSEARTSFISSSYIYSSSDSYKGFADSPPRSSA